MSVVEQQPERPAARVDRALTLGEIAERLGCSRATVFDAERRALKKIRFALECEAAAAGLPLRECLFGE